MRWSQFHIQTLRESPAEAEIASHQLLLRASLARKLAGGLYTFLPLGLRTLRKVEAIVRDEMNAAGALEVLMPALQPVELWQKGPRWAAAQKVMFKAQSATARSLDFELVLGPTHEEAITELVAGQINSYKQLPKTFYQIQTKFRDEIRPRFGLMRAKEFLMKDAYSFDASDEEASRSYEVMFEAYRRIFRRMGLKAKVVEADTGVMGGKFSHEFQVPCAIGESEVVFTEDGAYAAAIERAQTLPAARKNPATASPPPERFETPGAVTIDDLATRFGAAAQDQIKTLVYLCDGALVMLLLRGDDQLCEDKVGALGYQEYRAATADEIEAVLGARPGSLGGVGVKPSKGKITRIVADETLRDQRGMVTGANQDGVHLRHVDVGRDLAAAEFAPLRLSRAGETTTDGRAVQVQRAIEVGHTFKLGTKYSEALEARFLDRDGKSQPCVMGCYGIGVTRCLQAIIEQNHDADGICWPATVAPFQAVICRLDASLDDEATALARNLEAAGIDVLIDDRDERPGVKFKDADLIGFPVRITLGEKSWKAGGAEFKSRASKPTSIVPMNDAVAEARKRLFEEPGS